MQQTNVSFKDFQFQSKAAVHQNYLKVYSLILYCVVSKSLPISDIPFTLLDFIWLDNSWAINKNRYGEMGQPCLITLCMLNLGEVPFVNLILLLLLWYKVLIAVEVSAKTILI